MTLKEMEHLDFNPVAIALVVWWDGLMWWIREMIQGDSGNGKR